MHTHHQRFDANCSILFTELPLLKRPQAARSAGFEAVEFCRGAPGTGTLDFEALFRQLATQGYTGRIGCEYKPSDPADGATSFGWR